MISKQDYQLVFSDEVRTFKRQHSLVDGSPDLAPCFIVQHRRPNLL